MSFKFNPITSQLDIDTKRAPFPVSPFSTKLQMVLSIIAAFDKIASINYVNAGQRGQRITSIQLESLTYPDAEITKTVTYLSPDSLNQRIDQISFSGSVLGSDTLVKSFVYTFIGNKYVMDGYNYEII